jgi:hypothetical protein
LEIALTPAAEGLPAFLFFLCFESREKLPVLMVLPADFAPPEKLFTTNFINILY